MALAAQGFDRPRPKVATAAHLRATMHRLGVVQIDFVNVLTPAHYVTPYSRIGAYDRAVFDGVVYREKKFTEQWAHEAAIIPNSTWPLLRHRMDTHRVRPWGFESYLKKYGAYVDEVLDHVRARGPLSADELPAPDGQSRRLDQSWFGTIPRAVLEYHFGRGALAVAGRRPNMARVFDLSERIIPGEHHAADFEIAEQQRRLILLAAKAHGIGTAADLGDYYRLNIRHARDRIKELVEAGQLREVQVEGWRDAACLHPQAKLPKAIEACALLSPFDPVVWFRPRAQRLFDFEYRIEIYTPKAKRRWGYYVLPFLLHERIAARVDLKADRAAHCLRVVTAHLESHANTEETAEALAVELRTLAAWLGLASVTVGTTGKLSPPLRAALKPARRPA